MAVAIMDYLFYVFFPCSTRQSRSYYFDYLICERRWMEYFVLPYMTIFGCLLVYIYLYLPKNPRQELAQIKKGYDHLGELVLD